MLIIKIALPAISVSIIFVNNVIDKYKLIEVAYVNKINQINNKLVFSKLKITKIPLKTLKIKLKTQNNYWITLKKKKI